MVQGAAAEFFKTWAVIVRARLAGSDTRIVLALHDELLLHAPEEDAAAAADALERGLDEAAHRWLDAGAHVRFVADAAVGTRWSDLS
jgi:DNA polymerase-1